MPATETIDTLINARWVIPVEPGEAVYDDHALAIRDGHIVALLPQAQARQRYQPDETVDLPGHALIPGLVNTHTHASMSLFRGLADDLPLMTWLNEHIWPAEGRWVNRDFVRDGARLAMAEMIRGGTTCFNDMYFFPDQVAEAARECGLRAVVGLIVIDMPTAWAGDTEEYFRKGIEVHDNYRSIPLIHTCFAPHAPYTVSDAPLRHVATLAEELDIPIHIHVHETAHEVETAQQRHGQRPLRRLRELGLLGPRLLAVHMTQLETDEIQELSRCSVNVVHCPESNLKLASGFCPLQDLLRAGVNVALGTDGAASNNDLDMLGEMRSAALLAKAVSGDPTAVPAHQALRMATLNGARALAIDEDTGSLEIGKSADILAIDLGALETSPVYDPISQIVYAAGREQVTDVWVAGRQLLRQRELTGLDVTAITAAAAQWRDRIQASDDQAG